MVLLPIRNAADAPVLPTTTTVPTTDRTLLLRQVRAAYMQAHSLSRDAHHAWQTAALGSARHKPSPESFESLRSYHESIPTIDEIISKQKTKKHHY